MIRVTRINHQPVVLNADLIEFLETTPDTVITLTTGHKIMVLETPQEIVEEVVAWKHRIAEPAGLRVG